MRHTNEPTITGPFNQATHLVSGRPMCNRIAIAVEEQSQVTQEIANSTQKISNSSRLNLEDAE
jgi:hypothetical protein